MCLYFPVFHVDWPSSIKLTMHQALLPVVICLSYSPFLGEGVFLCVLPSHALKGSAQCQLRRGPTGVSVGGARAEPSASSSRVLRAG